MAFELGIGAEISVGDVFVGDSLADTRFFAQCSMLLMAWVSLLLFAGFMDGLPEADEVTTHRYGKDNESVELGQNGDKNPVWGGWRILGIGKWGSYWERHWSGLRASI